MKTYKPHVITWLARRDLKPTRLEVEDGRAVLYVAPDAEARAWRGSGGICRTIKKAEICPLKSGILVKGAASKR